MINRIVYNNRNIALQIMERVFKKNMKKRLAKWKSCIVNENEVERVTAQFSQNRQDFMLVARYGAVDIIRRIA
jgi:hypothetical protein